MDELNELVERSHGYAVKNGFYDKEMNIAEKLMLIVSELGEALEVYREKNEVGDMPPLSLILDLEEGNREAYAEFKAYFKDTFGDEIADTLIRILDLCGALEIPIGLCVRAKMGYNDMRPYKHGKQF